MGNINDYWKVYHRCLIPKTPPDVDLCALGGDDQIRNYLLKKNLLLARWTSDFDCGKETEWYYVIKDDEFDISKLNSNRRYKINKGNKNFYTKVINPQEYVNDIYEVTTLAFMSYPLKYRPVIKRAEFIRNFQQGDMKKRVFIGVFDKRTDKMCGYASLYCYDDCMDYSVHKTIPNEEKRQVNAALVFGVLQYFEAHSEYRYLNDGARNIRHETAFQDYLQKYFGFRKAYCKLNIVYHPVVDIVVKMIYPFRNIINFFKNTRITYNIYCAIEQEKIRRTFT